MMLRELQETPRGKQFLECQTLEEIWLVNTQSLDQYFYLFFFFFYLFTVKYGQWENIVEQNF